MTWVYIVECSDGSYYTGWTSSLEKRIKTHANGKASRYTRARLPVRLVYCEKAEGKKEALKRECAIKKLNRAQKAKLINKDTAE
ncbi:MAG: GIY-YIG nuclease family protein [Tindallia sp. MSAO_Bac2]|nr:MAG: GIY-YIG nuclease family protein [Tindallia sp. MSAO_Bac2]